MIRGTTPTHTFNIPFDTSLVDEVKITYAQEDEIVLTKGTSDCVLDGSTIQVTLSQEDTFKFDQNKFSVQIQLRILTKSGEVLASIIEHVGLSKCLDDEVLA
jgi:hypothetical protein